MAIGRLKPRSELEPVPRCEPSIYQLIAPSGPVVVVLNKANVYRVLGAKKLLTKSMAINYVEVLATVHLS